MSAVIFDTLKYAKRLKEGGFTEQQAETLASAEADLIEANLATKADIFGLKRDLKELELALRRDLKEVEAKLTRDIEALGYRLTIRLGGMIAFAIGAVATLVKVL
jgi:hypothetical protein